MNLLNESNELTAIFTASGKTAKMKNNIQPVTGKQLIKSTIQTPQSAIKNV